MNTAGIEGIGSSGTQWNALPDSSATSNSKKQTQRPDKLARLKAKVAANKWDLELWHAYAQEACQKSDPTHAREAFDVLLQRFPNSAKHWIMYIEFEQKQKDQARIGEIFKQCLKLLVNPEMWRYYLTYIQKTHSLASQPPEKRGEARQIITQAFELVLNNVGMDKESGSLWAEYIQFIKSGETTNMYEAQLKMDSQRRVYHRALAIPLSNIEALWKEYDVFENTLNKITAKKLLSEKSASYMTARTAYREMKSIMAVIDEVQSSWVAKPSGFSEKDVALLESWKRYVAWERSNPLHIDDKAMLNSRIMYAYRSAIAMMRFYPEVWCEASSFYTEIEKFDEALELLKQGVEVLPRSLLLNFVYAELLESRKKDYAEISVVFDKLVESLNLSISEVNTKYDEEKAALLRKLDAVVDTSDSTKWDGEARERERERQKEIAAKVEIEVEVPRKAALWKAKKSYSLAWIVYMRVTRRYQSIKSARNIFKTARKSPHCTYHVYVAAALMEYYCSKDPGVACKVFEAGMKAFAEDSTLPQYAEEYLRFLVQINDENNARALFERALVALPAEKTHSIWSILLDYEINYGELVNLVKTETRRSELLADESSSSKRTSERWSYLDINSVGGQDLGLQVRQAVGTTAKPKQARKGAAQDKLDKPPSGLQNLDSVNPDKYPRPDFTRWTPYKAEQPTNGDTNSANAGLARDNLRPSLLATAPPMNPQSQSVIVPEVVAKFLDILPTSESYDGPAMPINDIVDILRRLPVNAPALAPKMVPITVRVPSQFGNTGFGTARDPRTSRVRGAPIPSSGKRKGGGFDSDDEGDGRRGGGGGGKRYHR